MSQNITLSPLTAQDMVAYVSLYEQSFPPSERKDMAFMTQGEIASAYDLWVISTPHTPVAGLVIMVKHGSYVLLDYLAISPLLRGQGLGHLVLPLLKERYKDSILFLEIESPTENASNLEERLRRKKFYRSAGLVPCGVGAYIYGTDMELWAYPDAAPLVTFEGYEALICACFPQDMRPVRN